MKEFVKQQQRKLQITEYIQAPANRECNPRKAQKCKWHIG
jgi:hypothetical protein